MSNGNLVEKAQTFYHMFVNLERQEQFIKYFQNSEKIKLAQEWRTNVELLSFKEAVLKLYDGLMDHLQNKVFNFCKWYSIHTQASVLSLVVLCARIF